MRARDAAFLLTGAGTWVGKPAYLTTDPMTIQDRSSLLMASLMSSMSDRSEGPSIPDVGDDTEKMGPI